MAMQTKAVSSSNDIWGFKKDVFWEILKQGAVYGAVSGLIIFIGGILSDSLFRAFGFSAYRLVNDLFWGALWGALIAIFVVKFYDKFPFKTLFMKLFGPKLIIDLLVALSFGWLFIFGGFLLFIIWLVSIIVADYVYSKMVANKVGPLTKLS